MNDNMDISSTVKGLSELPTRGANATEKYRNGKEGKGGENCTWWI